MKWWSSPRMAASLLAVDVAAFAFSATFTLFGQGSIDAFEALVLAALATLGVAAWLRRWPRVVAAGLAGAMLVWAWTLGSLMLDVGFAGLFDDLVELIGYLLGLALLLALTAGHALTARGQWRAPAA